MAHGTLFKKISGSHDRNKSADAERRVAKLRELEELRQNNQDCLALVNTQINILGRMKQLTPDESKRLQEYQLRQQSLTKAIQDLTNALATRNNSGSNSNHKIRR